MRLYLVRHGKAEFGPEEADRKLSARGVADVQAMAQYLATQEIRVQRVVHSGLVRARETAEILAAHLAPDLPLEEVVGLAPWGDVEKFSKIVEKWHVDTLVCGHEPFLGLAASALLCGDEHADLVMVKTGTVMALEPSPYGPKWQLRWMLTPRIVRGRKEDEEQ